MDDKYDVERIVCHGCAAKDRKWHALTESSRDGGLPPFGEYMVVHPE